MVVQEITCESQGRSGSILWSPWFSGNTAVLLETESVFFLQGLCCSTSWSLWFWTNSFSPSCMRRWCDPWTHRGFFAERCDRYVFRHLYHCGLICLVWHAAIGSFRQISKLTALTYDRLPWTLESCLWIVWSITSEMEAPLWFVIIAVQQLGVRFGAADDDRFHC